MENLKILIMRVFTTAGTRAIMIGIALGIASTSIKIMLGQDRSYLGGELIHAVQLEQCRSPVDLLDDVPHGRGSHLVAARLSRNSRPPTPAPSSTRSRSCKPGDKVLVAFDYEPASEAELGPMATDFVHQCCEKKVKIYFIALWPVGPVMIQDSIRNIIEADYPQMVYGQDYVNLGYKSGYEGVIKVIVTDLRSLYTTDARGSSIDQIAMCRDVKNIQSMKLIVSVSAGYPGAKEWIQYAVTPYPDKICSSSAARPACSRRSCFPYLARSNGRALGRHQGGC